MKGFVQMSFLHSLFFLYVLSAFSCVSKVEGRFDVLDNADRIKLVSIKKIYSTLSNSCSYQNKSQSGQGMAIQGDRMYRLFNSGICKIYSISDPNDPLLISTLEMGSYGKDNHCNCAQFDIREDGSVFLYISSVRELNGLRGKCYVEKITGTSFKLVQTITVGEISFLSNYKGFNIICGDDGYLWLFGFDISGDNMVFVKALKPSVLLPNVELGEDDVVDYWFDSDYTYNESVTQGGTVHGGYLYSVFGTKSTNRHIAIYDINRHHKVGDINLNEFVKEEPEDCDFYGNDLILAIYGDAGYYALSLDFDE